MDYVGYVAILALLGFGGWLVWLAKATLLATKSPEEVKEDLPSNADLKKLKKAELVELAGQRDILVDIKSTKAVIISEIESKR